MISNLEKVKTLTKNNHFPMIKRYKDNINNKDLILKINLKIKSEKLEREYKILSNLNHPNILTVYDLNYITIGDIDMIYMSTEFAEHSDLINFLEKFYSKIQNLAMENSVKFEKFWRSIFIQIIEGLIYLKSKRISHGDIKPDNIFINNSLIVKIADIETACIFNEGDLIEANKSCGTKSYMPPEISNKKSYETYDPFKADIFSLGITFLNLITAQDWVKKGNWLLNNIKSGNFNEIWKNITRSNVLSYDFTEMLEFMLNYDALKRITLEEIKSCDWFRMDVFSLEELNSLIT